MLSKCYSPIIIQLKIRYPLGLKFASFSTSSWKCPAWCWNLWINIVWSAVSNVFAFSFFGEKITYVPRKTIHTWKTKKLQKFLDFFYLPWFLQIITLIKYFAVTLEEPTPDPKCKLNISSFLTLSHPLDCLICAKNIMVIVLLSISGRNKEWSLRKKSWYYVEFVYDDIL